MTSKPTDVLVPLCHSPMWMHMTGSRGIMQQSRCHCGWPADTMLAVWSRRHPDELDGCSRGQTPRASRQLGETFVRSVHHPLFKQVFPFISYWYTKKIGRLSIWCLHALERAQSHEELSYQPLCLSSFITPLTMNYLPKQSEMTTCELIVSHSWWWSFGYKHLDSHENDWFS